MICSWNSPTGRKRQCLEEHQIGWIAAIGIGGIAGWLAEQFMKSQMGLVMNIVLGMAPLSASWLLGFLGRIGYLIAGFIGACILIAIARVFSGGIAAKHELASLAGQWLLESPGHSVDSLPKKKPRQAGRR